MPIVPTQTGEFNRRVTIVARSTQRDAAGGVSETWTDVATLWACIRDQFSAQNYQQDEFVSKATDLIILRWSRSLRVTVSNRVRYTDPTTGTETLFEIESISNAAMKNREVHLLCYRLDGAL